jgi:hypothetical protein
LALALGRQEVWRQEDHKFEASLGYMERPYWEGKGRGHKEGKK